MKKLFEYVEDVFVAGAVAAIAYVIKIGDIWQLDWKMLVNLAVMASLSLALIYGKDYLNSRTGNLE